MFRIKIGEHITIGDVSRGPKAVVECDHINEVVDLIRSGALAELVGLQTPSQQDKLALMEARLREYGIEPS